MIDIDDGPTPDAARWNTTMEARPAIRYLRPDFQMGPPPSCTEEERKLLCGQKG